MHDWTRILKRRRSRRWDSSDPERAPPPLPLNPRSMSPATKNTVSPNIQAVAAKFQDRSSETALSSYTTNPMPPKSGSPERSLVKGHYHKRMQSLQPSDTKGDARSEFLNYLESRSPERPLRATIVDPTTKPQDSSKGPESPPARAAEREMPSYVSSRYLSKPLFGESTPPSATMLALQNMQLPIDNDPPSPSKPPKMLPAPKSEERAHTMDTLASQIHSLTDIASNLQREMSNLSRRSKDNATDLVSLKAATNARDEDIRKSLKELSSSLTSKYLDGEFSRFDLSAFLKPENGPNSTESDSSPNSKRSYSVPRMPSPNPFAFDRDLCGSPAPISDGSASIALLEKVLREMATKEGEERLLELVDEIKSRPAASPSDKDADTKITNMLEEILNLVKEDPSSKALVRSMPTQNLRPPDSTNVEGTRSASLGSIDGSATVRALNVPSSDNQLQRATAGGDEVLTILRSVKNSVVESGGMTNGVKALVRELRGEVLGMGRDLARKLETVESNIVHDAEPKDQPQPLNADQISAIINESLRDLQEQLAATVNESRNHSTALSEFQSTMNSAEIYSVVKKALDEIEFPQSQQDSQGPHMEKDDILDTVREAWETYKPEIELQTIGLERDEILECLAEGLKSYQPQHQQAITYEEVLAAVQTGLQNFTPPPVEHTPSITRDEIILTIRECLEKPESTSRGLDEEHVTHLNSMRDSILHAVSEKLQPQPKGMDEEHVGYLYAIRDEILQALSQIAQSQPRGMDEDQVNYLNNIRDQILHAVSEREEPSQRSLDDEHLHYLNSMRDDILHAVTERSQVAAPRSLDEEQFEHMNNLRDEILDAVTRSIATQSVVSKESFDSGLGRDDIVSAISDGLEAHFTTAKEMDDSRVSREDVVNAINDAFNAQQSALTPANPLSISREEIMSAIVDGIELANQSKERALSTDVQHQGMSPEEIFEAISEGLHRYHESEKSALSTEVQQPGLTRDEVFSAIVDGFESANTMTREIELNKEDLMEAITAGLQEATSATNLNVGDQLLERLQEAIGGMKEELKQYSAPNGQDSEQVLETIKDGLAVVRQEIESYVVTAQDVSGKHEIIDIVKEGFRLLQADMEKTITDTAVSHAPRSNPDTPELLDAMEKEFEHLRGTISNLLTDSHRPSSEKDEILDAIREVGEQHKSSSGDAQILSSIKEEFEALRERMEMSVVRAEPPASEKEDILAALQVNFDALHAQLSAQPAEEQIINSIKEHFESMRERMEMSVVRSEPPSTDKEDIIDALRESIDALREETMQLKAQPGEEQILNSIKGQFESMRERMEMSVVRAEPPASEKEDILAALQVNFDALHAQLSAQPAEEQIINSIKEQFETIRERMETSLVRSDPPASEKEEIVAALQENFDALHAQFGSQPADEQILSSMKEQFDAMRELVEMSVLRSEKEEIVTALQENLDALHAQLGAQPAEEQIMNSMQEQFDALREHITSSIVPAEPVSEKEDIVAALQENFDVLHAQLSAQPAEEQLLNSIKEQFDALREHMSTSIVPAEPISEKEDIIAALQENFDTLHAQLSAQPAEEQIINSIKEQFESIRERMEMSLVPAEPALEKEDIVAALQPNFDSLNAQLSAQPGEEQILNSMKEHFETLRERMEMSMVPAQPPASDKEDVLSALREHFDSLKEQTIQQNAQPGIEQVLDSMNGHFENMRERMEMSVVRAEPPSSDKEDIIGALRGHFDTLREETIQHNKDGTDNMLANTSEILVAFNGGIESIREDVQKVLDKPAEFDASEILETVKEGFAELRFELESLRQPEKEESNREIDDAETTRGGEMILANESSLGPDIEGLKSLISQLTEKVDSIDSASSTDEQSEASEPVEDALNRGHLDEIMVALQEVQLAMGEMSANKELPEGVARKEDTDALENLILSTKAQLDEINFPAPEELASAEQIAALETMVREAKDAITEFSSRLEAEGSTKADIGTLEGLIKDVWISVDELKGISQDGEETEEGDEADENGKLLKSDLQTVEAMIFEVKTQIDELKLPDVETLPTKEEITELSSLVTDFRDKMEAANDLTAQGFEARKIEHGGLAEKIDEKIDEAKYVVGELGDELKSKLDGSSEGLNELKQLLEGLALSAESFTTVENVKELTDLINREFERVRGEDDATKLDKEERDAAALVKHDETRAAIIHEIGTKIDEKICEILSKYDDAHSSLHFKFSETEERDMAHAEMVTSTKSLAEDIKLVIGSMGTTVTETCERMAEDTKVLAEKVGESYTRMEEMQNEAKSHQEQSRGENERAVAATERVETKLLEFHPQILQTVQEILTVVSDHYDHSQKSTEEVKSELSALPSTMLPALPPPESTRAIEDDPVHNKLNDLLEHAKSNPIKEVLDTLVEHSKNDQLHSKLDRVLEASAASNSDIYEKLNLILDQATSGSGSVHEKLDALLERPVNAVDPDHTVTQMMKLDEMHKDIMENSRRMNEMFAAQSALVAEDTERKRREAEEAAVALERRVAQREQVESEIVGLHEEKDSLLKMLHTLKTEKDELTKQNAKMSKELSGLETALEIRHEEMQQMEERADGLEKRILEGVLDHARSVLLSRSGSISTMNLKRNRSVRTSRTGARSPSMMSTATVSTAREPKDARSLLGNGVGMALKRRTVHGHQPTTTAVQPNIGKERRILSLSHVTGNRDAGRQIGPNTGMPSLKRSHSVKSNFSLRKASWAGPKSTSNKENEAFHEEDELQSDIESDAGTERKTSYAGTDRRSSYAGTERKASYAETCTDSVVTGVTESVISEDRRTSGMSGTSDGRSEYVESSIADDDHDHDPESDREGSEASSQSDDENATVREDDDGDDVTEKEENGDDQFSDTASVVEAEGQKLLEAPPDSLGTEMTVS
ncbi:hypothetical protein N7493_009589 [Penicillium malachiteum]|uniref:Chromosome segregation ATPase family protein n=1 Tax=Penicillium malachiteum TaxID=1324776 RepID=A0AAD6HEG6_9EURO|nr:hypothetical protein N7493_009589 [Penicillium malachiteum]